MESVKDGFAAGFMLAYARLFDYAFALGVDMSNSDFSLLENGRPHSTETIAQLLGVANIIDCVYGEYRLEYLCTLPSSPIALEYGQYAL